jgi:flavin-dependent dehydrogenase
VAVEPRTVEVHFFQDTLPGFLWVFPTGDGIVNVGVGLVHRELKRRGLGLRAIHERVVSDPRLGDRFRNAERLGPVVGWNLPTPDFERVLSGDGFVLVGDAAGLVDPFSGEGIGNAMDSGKVAADTIAEALRGPDVATGLAEYARRLWRVVDAGEISLHYKLRRVARHGRLIDLLVGAAAARPDHREWLRSLTAARGAVERKRGLLSPITYAKLLLRR